MVVISAKAPLNCNASGVTMIGMNRSLILPARVNKVLEEASDLEGKQYIDVIEAALIDYVERKKRWFLMRQWGKESAKKAGVSRMNQVEKIVDEFRR